MSDKDGIETSQTTFLVELTYLMEVNLPPTKYWFKTLEEANTFYEECVALYNEDCLTGYSIVIYEEITYCNLEEELKKLKIDHPEFYKSAFEHDPSDEPVQCEGARRKVIPKKGIFGKLGRTETTWVRCENTATHTQLYGSTQYELCKDCL